VTRIKICGLTRAEDALAACGGGADAVGLVFYEASPRRVSLAQAAQIASALPPFVTIVGLFVDAEEAFVRQVLAEVPLCLLQFHGDEAPEYCAQFSRPYVKAIRVKEGVDLLQSASVFQAAKGLLLDAHVEGIPGGTGTSFDWSIIPSDLPLPVILSGGLNVDNVGAAIESVRPYAVDVSSGVEASRGIKDVEKITAFINQVRQIDVQLSR
jgi:phosphoribosylanthranilate isomerase